MSLSSVNSQRSSINDSQETLVTLAAETGGKAFLDSNDLSLGLKQVQEEFRSYYILGYMTNNNALDGKYRKIVVKLKANTTAKLSSATVTMPRRFGVSSTATTRSANCAKR